MAKDIIFVDNSRLNLFSTSPIINGLSEYNAQILTIKNIYATRNKFPLKHRTRLINNEPITNFQTIYIYIYIKRFYLFHATTYFHY